MAWPLCPALILLFWLWIKVSKMSSLTCSLSKCFCSSNFWRFCMFQVFQTFTISSQCLPSSTDQTPIIPILHSQDLFVMCSLISVFQSFTNSSQWLIVLLIKFLSPNPAFQVISESGPYHKESLLFCKIFFLTNLRRSNSPEVTPLLLQLQQQHQQEL